MVHSTLSLYLYNSLSHCLSTSGNFQVFPIIDIFTTVFLCTIPFVVGVEAYSLLDFHCAISY